MPSGNGEHGLTNILPQFSQHLRGTAIHLIEDTSLIKDAPNLQPSFSCKELPVMEKGKLPNRRRPLLGYFMSSF